MNPKRRLLLAALAAATIATLISPAEAARHRYRASSQAAVTCDLHGCSDLPGLRTAGSTPDQATRGARRAASRSAKSARVARHSHHASKIAQEPPNGQTEPDANGSDATASTTAEWPRTLHKDAPAANGSGIVRSAKTGATARVSPKVSAQFQGYVDDLERAGARVLFIGGYRKGACWSGGRHPCGLALDVCQLSRGRVDRRCNLPGPAAMIRIAAAHGLLEGAVWGNSDYGHAQAPGPFGNHYASRRSTTYASARSHHHRRIRMARQ